MNPEEIESKEFLISLRGYDREQVDAYLRELADEIRALRAGAASAESAGPSDSRDAYREIGTKTSKILMAAEDAGEEILSNAKKEAAAILADARVQASAVQREAASEMQRAEEDLRKLRQARTVLTSQLEDIGRRIEEMVGRLQAPIEEIAAPKGRRGKPQAAAPPVAEVRSVQKAPPSEAKAETIEAADARKEVVSEAPSSTPPPTMPSPAAAEPAAPATASVAPEAPAVPTESGTSTSLRELLEEVRREREEGRHRVAEALEKLGAAEPASGNGGGAAPAGTTTPVGATQPAVQRPKSSLDGALERRTQVIGDAPDSTARRLKRALQEDQNLLLDNIRTQRGKGTYDETLAPIGEQQSRFEENLGEPLEAAFLAGRRVAGGGEGADTRRVISDLVRKQVVNPLRKELSHVVDAGVGAQDTPTAISERSSDVFRVWKGVRTELLGEGLAHAAYHQGLIDGWREQGIASKRWVFDANESQCPRNLCESNASGAAIPLDGTFSSGHLVPPAHGGCTCTLATE